MKIIIYTNKSNNVNLILLVYINCKVSHYKRANNLWGAIPLSTPLDLDTVSYESFVVRDLTLPH